MNWFQITFTRKTHLEALGRSFDGISAWLNLPPDDTEEGQLRAKYTNLVVKSIANAVNPESPDYMRFDGPGGQPLVDAAFRSLPEISSFLVDQHNGSGVVTVRHKNQPLPLYGLEDSRWLMLLFLHKACYVLRIRFGRS